MVGDLVLLVGPDQARRDRPPRADRVVVDGLGPERVDVERSQCVVGDVELGDMAHAVGERSRRHVVGDGVGRGAVRRQDRLLPLTIGRDGEIRR